MAVKDEVAELVMSVVVFVRENPYSNGEAFIRETCKKIGALFEGMDNAQFWVVTQLLRRVQMQAHTDDLEPSVQLAIDKIMLLEETPMPTAPGLQKIYKNIMEMFEKTGGLFTNTSLAAEYSHKIATELNLGETQGEFVSQYYEMDPETEDVLANAKMVLEDMVVLVEDTSCRQAILAEMTEYEISRARMWNRWATVTFPEIKADKYGQDIFSFVAVYDDETKRKIFSGTDTAWIVKLDSVPRIDEIVRVTPESNEVMYTAPAKKVVEALKDALKAGQTIDTLHVQTGKDGDMMTAHEYLIAEGAVASPPDDIYEIIDRHGRIEYSGSAEDVVQVLVRGNKKSRATSHVAKTNVEEAQSALEFLKDHGVRIEGESFQRDIVLDDDNLAMCSGDRETVMEFLRHLDPSELNQLRVKVYESDETLTVAQYFNLDEFKPELGAVYSVMRAVKPHKGSYATSGSVTEVYRWIKENCPPESYETYDVMNHSTSQVMSVQDFMRNADYIAVEQGDADA